MEQTVSFHRLSEIAGLGSPAETALVIHAVRIFSLMYLFRGYEPVLLDCAYVANETDLEYFRSARAAVKTRLSNGTNAYNTAQKERGPSRYHPSTGYRSTLFPCASSVYSSLELLSWCI